MAPNVLFQVPVVSKHKGTHIFCCTHSMKTTMHFLFRQPRLLQLLVDHLLVIRPYSLSIPYLLPSPKFNLSHNIASICLIRSLYSWALSVNFLLDSSVLYPSNTFTWSSLQNISSGKCLPKDEVWLWQPPLKRLKFSISMSRHPKILTVLSFHRSLLGIKNSPYSPTSWAVHFNQLNPCMISRLGITLTIVPHLPCWFPDFCCYVIDRYNNSQFFYQFFEVHTSDGSGN